MKLGGPCAVAWHREADAFAGEISQPLGTAATGGGKGAQLGAQPGVHLTLSLSKGARNLSKEIYSFGENPLTPLCAMC